MSGNPYGPNKDRSVKLSKRMRQPMLCDGDRIPDYYAHPPAKAFAQEVDQLEKKLETAERRVTQLEAALRKIADTESTEGYLRDIRGGNAEIAAAALAASVPATESAGLSDSPTSSAHEPKPKESVGD